MVNVLGSTDSDAKATMLPKYGHTLFLDVYEKSSWKKAPIMYSSFRFSRRSIAGVHDLRIC